MQISVIGSGSWGTALALILARNGHSVDLLGRDPEEIASMRATRENLRYLPGFALPDAVAFGLLDEPPPSADLVVLAIPSGGVREVLENGALSSLFRAAPLLIATKGLEVSGKLLADVATERHPQAEVGVISGPNLAVEMVRGIPTAAVIGFAREATAEPVRQAFMSSTFRVYISDDVIGLQLAGALKNVVAIGAGMSDGLGFGDNTKGALLARGWREMLALGLGCGAKPETFMGIAGIGDLFATAASHLSRNYRLGYALATGAHLADARQSLGQVAEGVPTAEASIVLSRQKQVQIPVFEAIEAVIRGRIAPRAAVANLMGRTTPHESIPAPTTSEAPSSGAPL